MARSLSNAQWRMVRPLIPEPESARTSPRGGRPWRDSREVLDAVLWVLRTGSPWADLPRRYPPPQTCHRRFQRWVRSGVMDAILGTLGDEARIRCAPIDRLRPATATASTPEVPARAAA